MLEQLQIKPSEALLIDDSAEKVKQAEKHGFQTIQFTSESQLGNILHKRNIM